MVAEEVTIFKLSRLRQVGSWETLELAVGSPRFALFTLELTQRPLCNGRTYPVSFTFIQGIPS